MRWCENKRGYAVCADASGCFFSSRSRYLKEHPFKDSETAKGACQFVMSCCRVGADNKEDKSQNVFRVSKDNTLTHLQHSETCPSTAEKGAGDLSKWAPFRGLVSTGGSRRQRLTAKQMATVLAKEGQGGSTVIRPHTIYRARRHVRDANAKVNVVKFSIIGQHLEDIIDKNPGTTATIVTDDDGRFVSVSMSFQAITDAMRAHGRPTSAADFGHTKNLPYKGSIACIGYKAGSGNEFIGPCAHNAANESSNTWGTLGDCVEKGGASDLHGPGTMNFSDRHKGKKRFDDKFPDCQLAHCSRHLKVNADKYCRSNDRAKKVLPNGPFWRLQGSRSSEELAKNLTLVNRLSKSSYVLQCRQRQT